MLLTREDKVEAFLQASKYPDFTLAWGCYMEENLEMKEAAQEYAEALQYGTPDDIKKARANLVKEVADVQYVLCQLALFYRIDLEEAFNRVAENNMTKVQDGKVIYREDGKVLKPEGYQKPDMTGL